MLTTFPSCSKRSGGGVNMPHYSVMIQGRNFLVRTPDGPRHLGFYHNEFIAADGPAEAEALAIEAVRQIQKLKEITINNANDAPVLEVVELREIDVSRTPDKQQGFVFYPESQQWLEDQRA